MKNMRRKPGISQKWCVAIQRQQIAEAGGEGINRPGRYDAEKFQRSHIMSDTTGGYDIFRIICQYSNFDVDDGHFYDESSLVR